MNGAPVFSWNDELRRTDPDFLIGREWLVTNGLGGYASGTLQGVATRRFHGLFIPNLPSPRGRTMMVPKLFEEARSGDAKFCLSGSEYSDGRMESQVAACLREFRLEWQKPVWVYSIGPSVLEKSIVMPYGQNTTYVRYRVLEGPAVSMRLGPHFSCRMHDGHLGHASGWPFSIFITRGQYEVHVFEGAPVLRMCVQGSHARFVSEELLSSGVFYRDERRRGNEAVESLYCGGMFEFDVEPGRPSTFVVGTEAWESMQCDGDSVFDAEKKRLEKLLSIAPKAAQEGPAAQLVLAADQFIVLPWTRSDENVLFRASGERVRTVIAGYHWFTDWGRDTMISLEGLALCTGRHHEAKAILQTFAHYVKDGLLPNHFPEGRRTAVYNTADATFWYFHAIDRFYETTADRDTLEALFSVLESVVQHHVRGTQYGIFMDPRDGLIRASAEGVALTWMDAKVDEWVVTPRRGKPVEVQALWYNALKLMARWARLLGRSGEEYSALAKRAFDSFNARYWYDAGKYLYDVIDGDKGSDAALRPNQIFTLSLRYSVLDRSYWKPVVETVRSKLLTPYGLRTLDPAHREYHARYEGDRWNRDAAYHQGMVWAWLIGPFINAWLRVHRDKREARAMLEAFSGHLRDAGVGSISEIFDGDAPFAPRGCIAQAWSVAEVLRATLALHGEEEAVLPLTGKKEDPDERVQKNEP